MPSIVQNGSVKLVVTKPSQRNEDASLIAAIARGTCWFEELTSGKALSISSIASRENVTDSYISRLLNLALLSPTVVRQVLEGSPAATRVARHEMTGQRLSALWRKQGLAEGRGLKLKDRLANRFGPVAQPDRATVS
jgi:hypothetical protein